MLNLIKNNTWVVFLLLLSVAAMLLDHFHNKFDLVDFEVYHRTALRIIKGEPIYGLEEDGFYLYKYAPAASLLFLLFALIPFFTAQYFYWAFLSLVLVWGLNHLLTSYKQIDKLWVPLLGFALTFWTHVAKEHYLGQVNLLLTVGFVLILKLYLEDKKMWSALLLALSIFMKPFGLIFLPFFLLKRDFITIGYTMVSLLIVGALPFLFYTSWQEFIGLYSGWFHELAVELGKKQHLFAPKNHTIFSVIARYLMLDNLLTTPLSEKIYQFVVLGGLAGGFLYFMKRNQDLVLQFFMVCAVIPLLAFTSDNAFIYTFPLVVYMFIHFKTLATSIKVLLILGCFFIGGNIYDLLGKELFITIRAASPYAFGTVFLLLSAFVFGIKNNKLPKIVS